MLLDMLQLLYLQRADWTSRYLVIWHAGSTAFPFYPKRGLKIQSSSARRHVHSINFVSFFSWRVSWKFNSSFATRYVDSVSLSPKSGIFDMPTRQHFFFARRGDWKNPDLFCQSTCIWHFGSFSSRVHWKFALLLPVDTLTVVSFVSRADWKSSFTGVFCP